MAKKPEDETPVKKHDHKAEKAAEKPVDEQQGQPEGEEGGAGDEHAGGPFGAKRKPKVKVDVKQEAEAIRDNLKGIGFSLDPTLIVTILTTLLPALFKCFQQTEPDAANVAKYVEKHYNANAGEYRRGLLHRTIAQVHDAAEKEGKELNDQQALEMAHAVLNRAREKPETVQALAAQYAA